MKLRRAFSVTLWLSVAVIEAGFASPYQDGDLIFHESQSAQSKAIQEATASRWSHVGILFQENGRWLVAEAVQPVRLTTLAAFISRGKNHEYRIYRLPGLTHQQKDDLRAEAKKFFGRSYDIYFEWTDDLIYCSEFVYKVFNDALGIEVGVVQSFRDLKRDGPYARELIRRRLEDTGRSLRLDEAIVTPASQTQDLKLQLVERSEQQASRKPRK